MKMMKNFFEKVYDFKLKSWEFVKDIVSDNDIFNIKGNNFNFSILCSL